MEEGETPRGSGQKSAGHRKRSTPWGGGEGDCRGKIWAVPRPGRQGGATPQEEAPLPQLMSSSCL